jgi:hypothetical protein
VPSEDLTKSDRFDLKQAKALTSQTQQRQPHYYLLGRLLATTPVVTALLDAGMARGDAISYVSTLAQEPPPKSTRCAKHASSEKVWGDHTKCETACACRGPEMPDGPKQ